MDEQVIRTIELELISRPGNYYCTTCGNVVESVTFVLLEKKSRAIVTYMGITSEKHFICASCVRKNK